MTINNSMPPNDEELERNIVGTLLIESNSIDDVVETLSIKSFYNPKLSLLYKTILDIHNSSELVSIDIMSVVSWLRKDGLLNSIGGASFIAELTQNVNSSVNLPYNSKCLKELEMRRDAINIGAKMVQNGKDHTIDVFDFLDSSQHELLSITDNAMKGSLKPIGETVLNVIQTMYDHYGQDDSITGVPSGINELDYMTNGWQDSDLIIIAARPAMGKTALAIAIATFPAKALNYPVAFFSLEMSKEQLSKRLISGESEVVLNKVLRPAKIQDHEWEIINNKTNPIHDWPLYIDDTPSISILDFRAKCRRLQKDVGIKLIIVDYLQLMTGLGGNREQEIAYISRNLKAIAKELNVPVIALSQLSRSVETRGGDKRPILSDLRESGAIEQDADLVIFPHRPEYYGIEEDEEGFSTNGVGELIIAKHRQGSTGLRKAKFDSKLVKWGNL